MVALCTYKLHCRARTQSTLWGLCPWSRDKRLVPQGTQALGTQGQAFAQVMPDNPGADDLEGPLATVPLETIPLVTVPLAILYTEIPSLFKPKSFSSGCSFGVFCLRKYTMTEKLLWFHFFALE